MEGRNYYAATVRMVLTFDGCLRGTDICATCTEDLRSVSWYVQGMRYSLVGKSYAGCRKTGCAASHTSYSRGKILLLRRCFSLYSAALSVVRRAGSCSLLSGLYILPPGTQQRFGPFALWRVFLPHPRQPLHRATLSKATLSDLWTIIPFLLCFFVHSFLKVALFLYQMPIHLWFRCR